MSGLSGLSWRLVTGPAFARWAQVGSGWGRPYSTIRLRPTSGLTLTAVETGFAATSISSPVRGEIIVRAQPRSSFATPYWQARRALAFSSAARCCPRYKSCSSALIAASTFSLLSTRRTPARWAPAGDRKADPVRPKITTEWRFPRLSGPTGCTPRRSRRCLCHQSTGRNRLERSQRTRVSGAGDPPNVARRGSEAVGIRQCDGRGPPNSFHR